MIDHLLTQYDFEIKISKKTLKGHYYLPENADAVIILIHGMGEYAKRYEREVIPFFLRNSFAVYSYDQFGHGDTKGIRGYHPGYNYLLDAVDQIISICKQSFANKPMFLYGHSMGGNVAINYVLRRPNELKGIIATSPFLQLAFNPPKWKLFFGKILHRLFPALTMSNELDIKTLSRNPEEVLAYKNDPMIHDRISAGYSIEFMKTGEWAIENSYKLAIPMLLLHGTGDRITSHKASQIFAEGADDNLELALIKDGFHELHHDLDKQLVFEKINGWLGNQIRKT